MLRQSPSPGASDVAIGPDGAVYFLSAAAGKVTAIPAGGAGGRWAVDSPLEVGSRPAADALHLYVTLPGPRPVVLGRTYAVTNGAEMGALYRLLGRSLAPCANLGGGRHRSLIFQQTSAITLTAPVVSCYTAESYGLGVVHRPGAR